MQLMTKELEGGFPLLGETSTKKPEEIKIIAKFFCPWNHWTWYAVEYDPESRIFFGYVRGDFDEFGTFALDEMQGIQGPFGLGIERDLHFGEHTLDEAMQRRL